MAASWTCFEDQNYLTICLIQCLSGGGRGQEEGVGKRSWFSGTTGTSKVGGRTYFLFL